MDWKPISNAPMDGTAFVALTRVFTNGEFQRIDAHVVWVDDETGDVGLDAYQGWNLEDYECWGALPVLDAWSPTPPAPTGRDGDREDG